MTEGKTGVQYGGVIIVVGTMVVFCALGLARFAYGLLLPAMQQALEMDNTEAGALATANLIGYLTLSVLGGALASRYGPRAVIAAGLTVTGVGLVLTGLANGFATAVIWRTVTGVGSGASNVPVMGLLAAWFSRRRRGLASGIVVGGSSVALIVLGPTVPRILAAAGETGWRLCWLGFGGITLVLAIAALLLIRNRPNDPELTPSDGIEGGQGPVAQPVAGSWRLVYRSPLVWHLGLVYVAFGFSYIIYMTFFTKHLIGCGYSEAEAGGLFMVMGWCSLVCGVIWGSISDAIGRKWALATVYLIHTAAFGLFGLWTQPVGFILSAILFGLTAWSIPAIMAATCGDVLGPRFAPAGLGFITLFFGIGQALGPSVAGGLADATGSLRPALLLAAAVAFLGAIGSASIRSQD